MKLVDVIDVLDSETDIRVLREMQDENIINVPLKSGQSFIVDSSCSLLEVSFEYIKPFLLNEIVRMYVEQKILVIIIKNKPIS